MNDEELCAASGRGQSEAFVELVRRYQDAVCAVAYAVTQRRDVSEDIGQETFLVAWKKLPGIQQPERVGGWLTGIARNIARRRRPSDRVAPLTETETLPAPGIGQDDAMVEQQEREAVGHMLGALPLRYREALVLYYRDEQSAARVGQLLGISTSAAEQRLSRGRRMLQAKLERAMARELARTRPGEGFSQRVAAALPLLGPVGGTGVGGSAGISATATLGKVIVMKKLLVIVTVLLAIAAAYGVLRARPSADASPASTASETGERRSFGAHGNRTQSEVLPTGLAGRVTSAQGRPLFGATISVVDATGVPALLHAEGEPGAAAVARVDVQGRWTIQDLAPGTYSVIAAARGHLPARSKTVELGAEETVSGLDIELGLGGQTVTGVVTDAGGGPVEGAVVRALGPASAIYGALSDEDGRYSLTVAAGSYDVEARDPDYQRQTHRLTIGEADRVLDFQLIPGAAIFGTVVSRATGQPVPGATISFHHKFRSGGGYASGRSRDDERVTTNAQGTFALRQLRAAEYQLHATADHVASRAPTTVSVGIADQAEGLIIFVDPAQNVAGRVVDRADPSIGIANVDIEAFGAGTQVSVETRTGEDGVFLLRGVAAGSYGLKARGRDVIVASGNTVEVADADLEGIVVAVERGTSVAGRVEPAGPARLSLNVPADDPRRRGFELSGKIRGAVAQSTPDGAFELGSVPVGRWTLVAVATDGSRGTTEIDVPEGGLTDAVRVEMKDRPFIAGRIAQADGEPVVGATLTVVKYAEGASVQELFFMSRSPVKTTSDAQGRFALVGLESSGYRLTVEDRHGAALIGTGGAAFPLIAVDDEAVEDLQLVVERSEGSVFGVVRGEDGEPFGEAWVEVIATDETTPNELRTPTLSDASGGFRFEGLRPSTYNIHAASTRGDATASLEGVSLGGHDITLAPLGTIVGTVTRDGEPVELFTVSTEHVSHRPFAASAGRFELERVRPGSQRLVVTASSGAASQSIDVLGGEETVLTVELSAWGSVKGRVVDEQGDPLPGASITVVAEGGRRESPGARSSTRPLTDADGQFVVEGVGPGAIRIDFVGADVGAREDVPPVRGSVKGQAVAGQAVDLGESTLEPSETP